jgi:uncharacterized Zn finger protein (UPF0148 family)
MNEQIKKMAELLRSGATMLQDTCPTCNSPLFRFEGKVFCVKCGPPSPKPNAVHRSVDLDTIVPQMMSTILNKLRELDVQLNRTTDPESLYKSAKVVLTLLRALEHLKRLKAG